MFAGRDKVRRQGLRGAGADVPTEPAGVVRHRSTARRGAVHTPRPTRFLREDAGWPRASRISLRMTPLRGFEEPVRVYEVRRSFDSPSADAAGGSG